METLATGATLYVKGENDEWQVLGTCSSASIEPAKQLINELDKRTDDMKLPWYVKQLKQKENDGHLVFTFKIREPYIWYLWAKAIIQATGRWFVIHW